MKTWALLLASVLYLITAWDYSRLDQSPMAVAFLFYAGANVAFALA